MARKSMTLLGVLLTMFFCISLDVQAQQAQSYKRVGNNFEQVATKSSNSATKTSYTWTDSKGKKYDIIITETGRCFVMKTSSKTGKEYKYYLKEDLAKVVSKEVGIIYQQKK